MIASFQAQPNPDQILVIPGLGWAGSAGLAKSGWDGLAGLFYL